MSIIHLNRAINVCIVILIFNIIMNYAYSIAAEYKPIELRPINDDSLTRNMLISKQYIYAERYIKSKHDAETLLINIQFACKHDIDIYDELCRQGDMLMCLKTTEINIECEDVKLRIKTDMYTLK